MMMRFERHVAEAGVCERPGTWEIHHLCHLAHTANLLGLPFPPRPPEDPEIATAIGDQKQASQALL